MSDGLVFPNTRIALETLLTGTVHAGKQVHVFWWLGAGTLDDEENIPAIVLDPPKGTEGYIDRVDRHRIECYAPGEQAVEVLESVKSMVVGENIDLGAYALDEVKVVSTPEDVPYPSDTLNQAVMVLDIVTRPITIKEEA